MLPKDFADTSPGDVVHVRDDVYCFVPSPLPEGINLTRAISEVHEKALLALGELRAIIPSLPRPELVTSPFLRREAVLSSRIEGTNTELEQLYLLEMEEEADSAPASPLDEEERNDALEVRNYIKALSYGMEQLETRPIHNRLLREMHQHLLSGSVRGKDKDPGNYRSDRIALIGGTEPANARYVAPPPGTPVDHAMNQLELYINSSKDSTPRLIRIAMIHYQFEAIHPFNDGNGRLGRLLVSLLLSQWNLVQEPLLYLSAYFEAHRDEYGAGLWEVSRSGAWHEWITFFLNGVTSEAQDSCQRARKLMQLRETYRNRFHKPGTSAKVLELVDYLFEFPLVSVRRAESVLELSYQAASLNIRKLTGAGILAQIGEAERNRIFVAREILDLLE